MTAHIKTALAVVIGIVVGSAGLDALKAQTKALPAYWVIEVVEVRDQAAFMASVHTVTPTVQPFGGRYIVFGGNPTADYGPAPRRVAVIAFDSMDNAQAWVNDPTAKALRADVRKYAEMRSYLVEGTPD
jgi:uncharacterized protein (DUF1330 family)